MIVIVLCPLLFSCFGVASSFTKDVRTTMNAAALFHLPSVRECAPYRLLDNRNNLVVTIHENGGHKVSDRYLSRGTVEHLNQSILFVLHHVTPTDDGGLALETVPRSRSADKQDCAGYYFLTVSSSTAPGYWSMWGPWSACSATCERGVRIRHRNCTVDNNCFTGLARERQACVVEESCSTSVYQTTRARLRTDWSGWSPWGACSVTCRGGIRQRRRVCLDSYGRTSPGCHGNQTEFEVCNLNDCQSREKVTMTVGSGPNPQQSAGMPETIHLPLYVIVGTIAGLVMLVLVVVIAVLLARLRRRKQRDRHRDSGGRGNNNRNNKRIPRNPSMISNTPMSSHTYAEIPDVDESFGKNRERQPSACTIDNPYVGLPRGSATNHPSSPRRTSPGDVCLKVPSKSSCGVRVNDSSVYYNNPNVNAGRYPEDKSAYAIPLTSLR